MLRCVPVRLRASPRGDGAVRLSAGRRRIVCRFHFFRAYPLATTSGSTAARLIVSRRRLVRSAGESRKETRKENSMKYLLAIIAALALVGTASATSRSADCCGGNGCCPVKLGCCAE
jgi:hypothetical protein